MFSSWQNSCTDLQSLLTQSLQQSAPSESEDSIPFYRIIGLGFYSRTTTSGFYIDDVSLSSEKRDFVWEEVRRI